MPSGVRRRIPITQVLQERDFRAGLNLRADAFQLQAGETPDAQDVDFDPRGGIRMRQCYSPLNSSALPAVGHSLFPYTTASGTVQVLVGSDKYTYYSTGSSFTSIGTTWTSTNPQRASTFNDLLYVQNGVDAPRKWDGSTVTNLTQTFNDNLAAPSNGNMPIAAHVAVHMGYVWVANTVESATNRRNRIRFSHPNSAENWRTNDYIDVDIGKDGDQIRAIVPWHDRLIVFKDSSVHAIVGYSPSTFQVFPITQATGAVSREAVAITEEGLYWFNWPNGCFFYDGHQVRWLFERLAPTVWDHTIPDAYAASATVGVLNRRVYVSVPFNASTMNARTFVFDPTLGKTGGWTAYSAGFGPMLEWRRPGASTLQLACSVGTQKRVMQLNQNADRDSWLSDYLNCTGASGSYAWAPDSAGTSIVGDIDLRVQCALTNWTPAAVHALLAKWDGTTQLSYNLYVDTAGKLNLVWSANGTATVGATSSVATGITNGTVKWVRATLAVANPYQVKFYTSDDGVTWTQLGTTVNGGAGTSIFDSTARVTVGAQGNLGDAAMSTGKFYQARVLSGIAGTAKANPDFTSVQPTVASFADSVGPNTFTIVAPAALSGASRDVASYYKTRWFDANNSSVLKRFRRPDIILDDDYTAALRVDAFKNYDPQNLSRSFTISTQALSTSQWGAFSWGVGKWSTQATGTQEIARGASLGNARSVQLKISGPTPSVRWSVNAINLKFIARPVR